MPWMFSPSLRVSDRDIHHGTCVTHVPWCMPGSLTSGFLWSRCREKRSRHFRCMHNPQFYVSGKRPMVWGHGGKYNLVALADTLNRHCYTDILSNHMLCAWAWKVFRRNFVFIRCFLVPLFQPNFIQWFSGVLKDGTNFGYTAWCVTWWKARHQPDITSFASKGHLDSRHGRATPHCCWTASVCASGQVCCAPKNK